MSSSLNDVRAVSEKSYQCLRCGAAFEMAADTMEIFAVWVPQLCPGCVPNGQPARPSQSVSQVLDVVDGGPETGVFASGFCDPNPGAGGWGCVRVVGDAIVTETSGFSPATTVSRMGLISAIEALKLLSAGERATVYSASEVSVNTIRLWAPVWKQNGWRRGPKREQVANLDLVEEAVDTYERRPNATLVWLGGGGGSRWLAYADSVSRWQLFDSFENGDLTRAS